MAWRGRASGRRRRGGEVQIIRTRLVLKPAGYCSVSALLANWSTLQKPLPAKAADLSGGNDPWPQPPVGDRAGFTRDAIARFAGTVPAWRSKWPRWQTSSDTPSILRRRLTATCGGSVVT